MEGEREWSLWIEWGQGKGTEQEDVGEAGIKERELERI